MKKTILVLLAISLVFASADAQLSKTKKKKNAGKEIVPAAVVFTNDVDSMSYALGINVGESLLKNLKTLPEGKYNLDLFLNAFNKSMKGDSTLMKTETAAEYFKSFITKAQVKDAEIKKAAGEKFLEENKTKDSVKTTASGLQYQVLVATDGLKPQATDTVKVNYQGFLIDGTKFDSSVDRGEPVTFPLNQVIPGWTEGVQLMSVGSKYKFFVPYVLGYGEKGAGNGVIPAYATLIFEVELLDIKPFKQQAPKVEVKAVEKPKAVKGNKTKSVKNTKK